MSYNTGVMRKTAPNTKGEKMTNSNKTWLVEYSDHDMGCKGGYFLRPSKERADKSARLMKECGYQTTSVRQWTK